MSYMRGEYYVYRGKNLEICTPDGNASMPIRKFDELVSMRWSQLSKGQRDRAEKRAIKNYYGNVGCDELAKKHGLKSVVEVLGEISKKGKEE